MNNRLRELFHRYIPANFHDPFGLFMRLIRSRNAAALFAMNTAVLGMIRSPLDLLLQRWEHERYRKATTPQQPLIFVCGAPRTGTTLTAQVLIHNLPVTYINNMTAVFSRSPITASLAFCRPNQNQAISFNSYYGKSSGFAGPNDALYLWDRWFGKDRSVIPTTLDGENRQAMVQFFAAYEAAFQRPLITKNNNLNTYASLVADALENAYFICMTRDPLYHAQALLRARREIHGDETLAYGISRPATEEPENFVEDICRQTLFHAEMIQQQQALVGADRFWIVPYEEFCAAPAQLVTRVATEILHVPVDVAMLQQKLPPFQHTNRVNIEPELFAQLEQALMLHLTEPYEQR
ncbi:MAG: sulfotransferase [Caldilineaceae bacterium]